MKSRLKFLGLALFQHKRLLRRMPELLRMIKAIISKQYKPSVKNVLLPAIALVYIISPIDILPDFIPAIGVVDDMGILALVLPLLMKELNQFSEWEANKKMIKTIVIEN
ncbi:YkvA family protein [Riemerella anatipestifer]|uniref:YkvA family protein n=1 Tax=Riemerella anatipestifer TaxID=34085 RepID=UPI0030C47B0B